MKKLGQKLTMLGITLSTMMTSTIALAASGASANASGMGTDPSTFKPAKSGNGINAVTNFGNNILGIISTAASVLAVIILIVLGIKYMMGSAEEKAEYKKTLLPYVIGAVFVFGAGLICSILFGFAQTDWTTAS